jgi:hypothetical protein
MVNRRRFIQLSSGLFAPAASAQFLAGRSRSFVAVGASGSLCTTVQDTVGSSAANANVGDVTGMTFFAGAVTPASSYDLCKVEVFCAKVGSPTMNLTAYIWASSGSTPGALLATGQTRNASTAPASVDWFAFDLSYSLTASTKYYIGLGCSAVDAANYINWRRGATSTGETDTSSDGSSWLSASTRQPYMRTYS